jgi:hypothetical protein
MLEETISYPSWKRYVSLAQSVKKLRVREKRQIFMYMRMREGVDHNSLLPRFGFSCGEFAVFHIVGAKQSTDTNEAIIAAS